MLKVWKRDGLLGGSAETGGGVQMETN